MLGLGGYDLQDILVADIALLKAGLGSARVLRGARTMEVGDIHHFQSNTEFGSLRIAVSGVLPSRFVGIPGSCRYVPGAVLSKLSCSVRCRRRAAMLHAWSLLRGQQTKPPARNNNQQRALTEMVDLLRTRRSAVAILNPSLCSRSRDLSSVAIRALHRMRSQSPWTRSSPPRSTYATTASPLVQPRTRTVRLV